MTAAPAPSTTVPGAMLLHPWPLAAALCLVVNMMWLRPHRPGVISGKLSDFGICFLLPVVLAATCEWVLFVLGRLGLRTWVPRRRSLALACCIVTGA